MSLPRAHPLPGIQRRPDAPKQELQLLSALQVLGPPLPLQVLPPGGQRLRTVEMKSRLLYTSGQGEDRRQPRLGPRPEPRQQLQLVHGLVVPAEMVERGRP